MIKISHRIDNKKIDIKIAGLDELSRLIHIYLKNLYKFIDEMYMKNPYLLLKIELIKSSLSEILDELIFRLKNNKRKIKR